MVHVSAPAADGNDPVLTTREQEVLRLVAERRSNREISEELMMSVRTATTHIVHIIGKLGASSRGEAIDIARRLGLI